MARFFPGETISRIHGRPRWEGGLAYFAMYHPAAALRNGQVMEQIKQDFLKIEKFLGSEPDNLTTENQAEKENHVGDQLSLIN